ncbi:MAG: C-GCAxxG-C-C family protein [Bacillota bacterium]|nr:C-GCAxxG-C-C family protein [Bacillota bacterium]
MRPSEYYKQGFTCGEAMIKAYNEEHNTNIPVSLGSGMGTGFTVGSVCGSVGAAAAIVGLVKGRENSDVPNEARKYTKQLMQDVREKFGTEICRELKQKNVSCNDIIEYTYEMLNKVL